MSRWLGALLVLAACGGTGLRRSWLLGRRVSELTELLSCLGTIETEICLRRAPLPRVLERLSEVSPGLFPARRVSGMRGEALEVWAAAPAVRWREEREVFRALGAALLRGEAPESAAAACRRELEELRCQAAQERTEKGRLYAGGGLCAGALLVILLL